VPRWLSTSLAKRDPAPSWQSPFLLSFTGIRGIVSLAAALAVPFTTESGAPFPYRDLILFLTFSVIVVTLVGQGLMLPAVIQWLGLVDLGRNERTEEAAEELAVRHQAIEAVLHRIDELAVERALPDAVVAPLRAHHAERLHRLDYRIGADELEKRLARLADEVELLLVEAERKYLYTLLRRGEIKDEARRHIEHELDLREAELTGGGH